MAYMEGAACVWAGLDLWQWDMGLYPISFKERVCALFNLSSTIATHIQDAKARAQEKAAKKK